jgi:TM2 domain-containing membrane protein YozV
MAYNSRKKEGALGFALSCLLIPGAGHFYCGEIGMGFLFLGVDAALVVGMFTLGWDSYTESYYDYYYGYSYYDYYEEPNAFFYIAVGLLTVSRVFEWVDCFSAAKRYNEKIKKELGIPPNVYLSFNYRKDKYNNLSPRFGLNYAF